MILSDCLRDRKDGNAFNPPSHHRECWRPELTENAGNEECNGCLFLKSYARWHELGLPHRGNTGQGFKRAIHFMIGLHSMRCTSPNMKKLWAVHQTWGSHWGSATDKNRLWNTLKWTLIIKVRILLTCLRWTMAFCLSTVTYAGGYKEDKKRERLKLSVRLGGFIGENEPLKLTTKPEPHTHLTEPSCWIQR